MRGRWKIYLAIVVSLIIVIEGDSYYWGNISALFWHIRHGFHVELGDIRVQVPLLYEADDPHGLAYITLTSLVRRVRPGFSFIFINVQKRGPSQRTPSQVLEMQALGLERINERKLTFAGRLGTCVEFSRVSKSREEILAAAPPNAKQAMARWLNSIVDIRCAFGDDTDVSFLGTDNLRDDFYKILQHAEAIRLKS